MRQALEGAKQVAAVASPWRRGAPRALAGALALLTLTLAFALGAACVVLGLSYWSVLLAAALNLLAVGLVRFSLRRSHASRWLGLALLLLVGPLLARTLLVRGTDRLRLIQFPELGEPRLVNRLFPESDGTRTAAGLLSLIGGLDDEESASFGELLAKAYARMTPDADLLPTPSIATYLGMQSPAAFDSVVIAAPSHPAAPKGAVIFLHGYAGNFLVYCWEIAQAASAADLLTICPSVTSAGAWWTEAGDQTYQRTVVQLRDMGIRRIYLAGLSNGGAGASKIALRHQADLSGLILISGVRADHPPRLPTLVIQGAQDRMMPPSRARAYAARGRHARYEEVPGGHLIFLSRHQRVRSLIANFLSHSLANQK